MEKIWQHTICYNFGYRTLHIRQGFSTRGKLTPWSKKLIKISAINFTVCRQATLQRTWLLIDVMYILILCFYHIKCIILWSK